MALCDAHCHLQDERLSPVWPDLEADYKRLRVRRVVVNGTKEADWDAVAELAERYSWVVPSFGLHPWFVAEASRAWRVRLGTLLERFPGAGVGEVGLDRWIEGYDLEAQREAFIWQLELAAKRNRPVSIHCLQAWGPLQEALREAPLPERGVLIHSYGGSRELLKVFAQMGAYFSVSPYFAHGRKAKQREALRAIPLDRLLIETDAPDMVGPEEMQAKRLQDEEGEAMNHPVNIDECYGFVSRLFEIERTELEERVADNLARLFG